VQVVYEKDLQRGEKTYFAVDGVEHVAEVRVGNDGTKKVLYRLNDHLGGLERLVDAQGRVVGNYRFEPYGKLERYAGSEQSRYAWGAGGKEWVEELGWYEFGRRKYDAQLGGWVSRDPKEQFASLYATGANPLNSVDVDGEAEDALLAQSIMNGGNPFSIFGSALSKDVISTFENAPELATNALTSNPDANVFISAIVLAPIVVPLLAEATTLTVPESINLVKEFFKYRPGLENKIVETLSKFADLNSPDPMTSYGTVAASTFISNLINNHIIPFFANDKDVINANDK